MYAPGQGDHWHRQHQHVFHWGLAATVKLPVQSEIPDAGASCLPIGLGQATVLAHTDVLNVTHEPDDVFLLQIIPVLAHCFSLNLVIAIQFNNSKTISCFLRWGTCFFFLWPCALYILPTVFA